MLRNGLAYCRKFHDPPETDNYLFFVPKSLRKDIMRLLYNNITAGHLGVTRTVLESKTESNGLLSGKM